MPPSQPWLVQMPEATEGTVLVQLHECPRHQLTHAQGCTNWTTQDSSQGKHMAPEGQGGPKRPHNPVCKSLFCRHELVSVQRPAEPFSQWPVHSWGPSPWRLLVPLSPQRPSPGFWAPFLQEGDVLSLHLAASWVLFLNQGPEVPTTPRSFGVEQTQRLSQSSLYSF